MEDIMKNIEKKIKGYGYDSLCLRYNIARDAQARYEIFIDMILRKLWILLKEINFVFMKSLMI